MCVSTCQVEFVLRELSCLMLLPRSRLFGCSGEEKNWKELYCLLTFTWADGIEIGWDYYFSLYDRNLLYYRGFSSWVALVIVSFDPYIIMIPNTLLGDHVVSLEATQTTKLTWKTNFVKSGMWTLDPYCFGALQLSYQSIMFTIYLFASNV